MKKKFEYEKLSTYSGGGEISLGNTTEYKGETWHQDENLNRNGASSLVANFFDCVHTVHVVVGILLQEQGNQTWKQSRTAICALSMAHPDPFNCTHT